MTFLVAIVGAGAAGFGLYLVLLALASFGRAPATAAAGAHPKVAVLVPAHDEEMLVGRCVRSLRDQTYGRDRYEIVVIADNCTDGTAAAARLAGARVLIRQEPALRGKGHALRWAMDRLLSEPQPPDAIAVVDADSVADRGMLAALAEAMASGNEVVQAEYSLLEQGGAGRSDMVGVGFLLFHRVRFRGRARLGMPANLVGNGMLLSSSVLRRYPWSAFTGAEDLEYSIALRRAGVRPFFAARARVAGPGSASDAGATRQRMRWEGGRLHVARTQLWPLVAGALGHGDLGLLDAALDLATPPLSALSIFAGFGLLLSGGLVAAGAISWWASVTWAVAVVAIPVFVAVGLWSAASADRMWRVLLGSPLYIGWKLATYARLVRGHDVHAWDRSDRVAS